MLQHASSPTWEGASKSCPSCSSYIVFQSTNVFNSTSLCRASVQGTAQPLASVPVEDRQLVSVTGHRRLRSSDTDTCLVQRTNTCFGDRSFAVAGPRVWNSLPTQLQESDITLGQFRLRCIYLGTDSCSAEWQRFLCAVYKLAYLLTYLVFYTAEISSFCNEYRTAADKRWSYVFYTAEISSFCNEYRTAADKRWSYVFYTAEISSVCNEYRTAADKRWSYAS